MRYTKYFTWNLLLLIMFLMLSSLNGCGSSGGGEKNADKTTAPKTWVKTYGGEGWEWASSIQQTSDGGYILAGSTESSDGSEDIRIIKLDSSGDVLWQKSYVSDGWVSVSAVEQASDGGYILTGYANSSDSTGKIWVVRFDKNGGVTSQKFFSSDGPELPDAILQTSDGGHVVAGSVSDSADGTNDTWVTRLNKSGGIEWQKIYIREGSEWPSFIQQDSDGGYIMAGFASDLSGGNGDLWVMRLGGDGGIAWQRTYGGDGWDSASSIYQTSDGGYILAGSTSDPSKDDYSDALILKLDKKGDVEWQKTFGSKGLEGASSIRQTSDGGYIVSGFTDSFGTGNEDILLLKLDAGGNMDGCLPGMDPSRISALLSADTNAIANDTDIVLQPATSKVLDMGAIGADSFTDPVTWCSTGSDGGKQTHTLTVNKAGNGVVTSGPGGIHCGYEDDGSGVLTWSGDCTHLYSEGARVILTPEPSTHSIFSGWSGDEDCSDGQVTIDSDKGCTANFNSRYRLDYVSGDNQTWGGGDMPFPMVFKIFDRTTGSYVEDGFDGLILSSESDTGYSDGDWCWGCLSDIELTGVASEASSYWYVEPYSLLQPYDFYIYVNAIDSYTGEHIENSPYLMHYTIRE